MAGSPSQSHHFCTFLPIATTTGTTTAGAATTATTVATTNKLTATIVLHK